MGRKKRMDIRASRIMHYTRDLYLPHRKDAEHGINPKDEYLREGRIPHIWCPGCGLGTVLSTYIEGLKKAEVDLKKHVIVSGIGCTARIAGYLNVDSYHTTHGRAIPFATGLKLANPELNVTVISGDGDLAAIGGNHLIHAARRNVDLNVICVNNFNYGMTGGQHAPTTPEDYKLSSMPYGSIEHPFNLCNLVAGSGACYVCRWTSFHVHQMKNTFAEMLKKKGFCFVEIIAQCPTGFGRPNKLGDGMKMVKTYKEKSVHEKGIDIEKAVAHPDGPIYVGKFVDIDSPTFIEKYNALVNKIKKPDEVSK